MTRDSSSASTGISKPSPRRWTRPELVRLLSLYCRLPFGKMHERQPDVIALSVRMNRSPGSVAMKLSNMASFDPELKARGIKGLPNATELDREVWNTFYGKWETLAACVQEGDLVEAEPVGEAVGGDVIELPTFDGPTERRVLATQRRGQAFFRKAVLAAYEGKCCVTGIAVPGLLRASHIVPWSVSRGGDEAQRLNPRNGLCLNAMHDAAFDSGLITLDEDRRVVLSRTLRDATTAEVHQAWFVRYDGQRIADAEKFAPEPAFLAHHRQQVFVA